MRTTVQGLDVDVLPTINTCRWKKLYILFFQLGVLKFIPRNKDHDDNYYQL